MVPLELVPTPTLVVPVMLPALVKVLTLTVPEGVRLPSRIAVRPSMVPVRVFSIVVMPLLLSD